ncbi:MAG: GAF domain-containing protein, partial [Nitrospinaceae bacterium]|nr:GAF domain-containing protein [Nitrospinaceae bacterium]NIY13897.1 GAF domain-containing protein [Nitrospinaceae bacterium]
FRIWTEWGRKKRNILKWVMEEADREEYKNSPFNNFVQSLRYPIRPGENILTETVLKKKAFNIRNGWNDPRIDPEFIEMIGCHAFATVPLIAHKEVLGVILVDNKYNDKPITDEQLRLLTRFTPHASWVIENSRLFTKLLDTNHELLSTKEQLIQSEKLAALGELSAEVAHEIKNPLVSIGGFARRLQEKLEKFPGEKKNLPEKLGHEIDGAANYSNIIVSEVDRLEKLLNNILLFSKSGSLELQECDVNQLLEE